MMFSISKPNMHELREIGQLAQWQRRFRPGLPESKNVSRHKKVPNNLSVFPTSFHLTYPDRVAFSHIKGPNRATYTGKVFSLSDFPKI